MSEATARAVALGLGVAVGARSTGAGLAVTLVAIAAARGRRRRREERDHARDRDTWTQLLAALALELRAGRSPAVALLAAATSCGCDGASPLGRALRPALLAAALPGDIAGALRRARPPPLRGLGAAWTMCERRGASLGVVVARLADAARCEAALQRARAAALAGPCASARLVCGLPVLGVLLAAALGAEPIPFLLHDPLGELCLVAGVILDLAALGWSARLGR